jgi:hypothetical protein
MRATLPVSSLSKPRAYFPALRLISLANQFDQHALVAPPAGLAVEDLIPLPEMEPADVDQVGAPNCPGRVNGDRKSQPNFAGGILIREGPASFG